MHYFILIYFNNKPLHVSSRLAAVQRAIGIVMRNVDWLLLLPTASQHNAWLYQLLFIHSWSSSWWAASLLETCRGLLL